MITIDTFYETPHKIRCTYGKGKAEREVAVLKFDTNYWCWRVTSRQKTMKEAVPIIRDLFGGVQLHSKLAAEYAVLIVAEELAYRDSFTVEELEG